MQRRRRVLVLCSFWVLAAGDAGLRQEDILKPKEADAPERPVCLCPQAGSEPGHLRRDSSSRGRSCSCNAQEDSHGAPPSRGVFPSPGDFSTRHLQEMGPPRRLLAIGCPSSSLAEVMNEEQCTVASIDRSDRGSYAGQPTSIDAFLVLGECSSMAFMIYGGLLGGLGGMGIGTLAIIGLVLICWPIAACKVLTRRCRRCCCSCCREGKEIRKIGNVKKVVILLLSAGLAGMAALPMAGLLGDLKATGAQDADCAARSFLQSALGDIAGIGQGQSQAFDSNSTRRLQASASFLGLVTAQQQAQTLSSAVSSLATAAAQAAGQDGGAAGQIQESVALLRQMQDGLRSQITVQGSKCEFCELCCGTQAGAWVPDLLVQLEGGDVNSVVTLSSDFQGQPGSRISGLGDAATLAGGAMGMLQSAVEAGPAPALVLGSAFLDDPMRELLTMVFEFGAVPLAGIGLVFIFYSLHWCCCLRRCKIDRKDHPAPQWAAFGWCGGCLGALLGAALGLLAFAAAALGQELCIMMETVGTEEGLNRYGGLGLANTQDPQAVTARTASLACMSSSSTARDLYPLLGLSVPVQGLQAERRVPKP
ncbi:unnamed protein product [Effrenium voratum]|nr:unnamed protein product [Effrenium voratum]